MIGNLAVGIQDFVIPAPLGDFESIATVTVGSGGSSSIDFTAISSDYQHLQIRLIARSTRNVGGSADTILGIRVGNTSIDTGNNYAAHLLYGDGASAGAIALTSQSGSAVGWITAFNATANQFGVAVIDILDYKNSSKNKTFRCLTGTDRNGAGQLRFTSGLWMNTSAIDTIRLYDYNGSGNFVQYTHAALYGIKG